MAAYRKLIVAIVGVIIMIVQRQLGLDLSGQEQALVDLIIGGLTAAGVWRFSNETA